MTPSKEAIEAFIKSYMDSFQGTILSPDECREIALNVAYAIDVVPLEQRVRELEAENQRLKACFETLFTWYNWISTGQMDFRPDIMAEAKEVLDKAQLGRGGGDVE